MTKLRVIFMGTPEFARVILEQVVASSEYDVAAVYAQPDKPVGRGNKLTSPPVAQFAKEKNLPLFQPEKIRKPEVLSQIQSLNADFILVAAYGKILPPEILGAARLECINVHASLLPHYRGAAPINHALLNDEKETGVDIMKMVSELDAGPVFFEKRLAIQEDDDAITLTDKLAKLGAEALLEALPRIANGELVAKDQNHAASTYATKLEKSMSRLDWNQNARAIFNQVRALVPWPVVECDLEGKRLKLYKTKVLNEKSRGTPGEILMISKEGWTVATKDFNILIQDVQLEGKKRMSAFDVANGLRLNKGVVLK